MMTVGELIDQLAEYDNDRPVAIAINPSWAMGHTIVGAVDGASTDDGGVLDPDDHNLDLFAVWIAAGPQLSPDPYAPDVWADIPDTF